MLSFRYHALSLVAVFLALVIGLLLGVAVGDRGLVSSAEKKVRDSLGQDVRQAQQERDDARDELKERRDFEEDAYPALVDGRLEGMRIALIELGGSSDKMWDLTRSALQGSGARLASVSVIREPLDLERIGKAARGTRYERIAEDPSLVHPFGTRIGIQFTQGGELLESVRGDLLDQGSGTLEGADGVVIVRDERRFDDPEEAKAVEEFEHGLIRGLRVDNVPVVGVETTDADPSQVDWFKEQDMSSVDDLDDPLGRAALVFALAGERGHFGVKSTADGGRLPPVL
ncbi:MAG TPA: copper transporter [Conexibacter sp.]|nr:copper transporter [Conexibacter sp.]